MSTPPSPLQLGQMDSMVDHLKASIENYFYEMSSHTAGCSASKPTHIGSLPPLHAETPFCTLQKQLMQLTNESATTTWSFAGFATMVQSVNSLLASAAKSGVLVQMTSENQPSKSLPGLLAAVTQAMKYAQLVSPSSFPPTPSHSSSPTQPPHGGRPSKTPHRKSPATRPAVPYSQWPDWAKGLFIAGMSIVGAGLIALIVWLSIRGSTRAF